MSLLCTSLLPLLFLGFIPKFSLSANVTNVTYLNLTDCLAFFALKVEVVNTESQGAITLPPTHVLDVTKSKCGTGSSVMAVSYSNVQDIRRLDLSIEFSLNYQHWVVNTANITTECISNSTVCIGVSNGQLDLGWLTAVDGMSFKCTSPPLVTLVSSTVNPPPLALRFTWLQVQPLGASGGRFSAATDCTGFFTIGIWSTLIVSFLLIGILTYGLQMLMSIKPNELYDDPKVKMVQLGALN